MDLLHYMPEYDEFLEMVMRCPYYKYKRTHVVIMWDSFKHMKKLMENPIFHRLRPVCKRKVSSFTEEVKKRQRSDSAEEIDLTQEESKQPEIAGAWKLWDWFREMDMQQTSHLGPDKTLVWEEVMGDVKKMKYQDFVRDKHAVEKVSHLKAQIMAFVGSKPYTRSESKKNEDGVLDALEACINAVAT